MTCLDRDGSPLDTDKSVESQGQAGWIFAKLYDTVDKKKEWLNMAQSCIEFSRQHCHD